MPITTDAGVPFVSGYDFYDHILKTYYRDGVAETVTDPNSLLKSVINNADKTRVSGKQIYFPIHIGRSQAYSAIDELGILPGADGQKYDNYTFFIRHMYFRVKVTGIMEDLAQDPGSYLRVWDTELSGAARDMQRQRQRVYWNDGSGRLCEAANTTASATQTVRLHSGVLNTGTCPTPATIHVKPGMRLALISDPTGSPGIVGVRTVLTVDSSTTITFDSTITPTAAGDCWVIASTVSGAALKDTGFKREPMGIAGIMSDDNPLHDQYFQGVDASAAANSWSRANILSNGGIPRNITSRLLDEAWEKPMEVAGVPPSKAFMSFKLRRTVADILKLDRRFNSEGGKMSYDGGHDGIYWNGTKFEADRDCWGGRIYLPYTPDLRLYTAAGPTWMSGDGNMRNRVPDQDAYEATMFMRETMGSDVRDQHTLLLDLIEV